MFVYAVVPATSSFEMCCGVASSYLAMSEVLIEEDPEAGLHKGGAGYPLETEIFPNASHDDCTFENFLSIPLLAAVCLGSSGGSFWNGVPSFEIGEQYWFCTLNDLTGEGKQLVAMLEKLYNVSPILLTFLDT